MGVSRARWFARSIAPAVLLTLAVLVPATPAAAATINVTTFNDEYDTGAACSLREATVAASTDAAFGGCSAGSGADVITLSAGTYELSIEGTDDNLSEDGDLDVFNPDSLTTGVTFQGAGMDQTIIDGNGFSDTGERVFDIRDGSVTFTDLTVRDGHGQGSQRGGGIFSHTFGEDLTLIRVRVHHNSTDERGGGVAVGTGSDLIIEDSIIANNTAPNPEANADGGGIYSSGELFMTNSVVKNNSAYYNGGGIYAPNLGSEITESEIIGNSVRFVGDGSAQGGGLYLAAAGELTREEAGGGFSQDILVTTLVDSIVAGNTSAGGGGGLFIPGCCGDLELEIEGTTFHDNSAQYGGGVLNELSTLELGAVYMENSTVSSNYAHFEGGGIYNSGDMALEHVTVYNNEAEEPSLGTGAGIFDASQETLTYRNSIIAFNIYDDCGGTGTSLGHNLLGDTSCPNDSGGDDTDIYTEGPPIDPRLGDLAFNGGPTPTHELLPGSPAIDGAEGGGSCPATDQRGLTRPTGAECDIGAYEVGDLTEVQGTDLSQFRCRKKDPTILGTPGNDTLVGTSGADVIQGREGVDTIRGLGGNDIICGGRGNDSMKGNGGADILKGLRGTDTYRGGPGKDLCIPGPGNDVYKSCEAPPQTV